MYMLIIDVQKLLKRNPKIEFYYDPDQLLSAIYTKENISPKEIVYKQLIPAEETLPKFEEIPDKIKKYIQ